MRFAILITTKNRVDDLKYTLNLLTPYLNRNDLECLISDDGSVDGTTEYIKSNYPEIKLFTFSESKGYIYQRNLLLNSTNAEYAISLDDDANFLSNDFLNKIESYFNENVRCALLAFRIFWGTVKPSQTLSNETSRQVNGFVGCGHAWRVKAWKAIPNYLEWYSFYGEEQFAAMQLFKNRWQIIYTPDILVHHRVNLKLRQNYEDYYERQRNSLSSGWYNMFLCYPYLQLIRRYFYTLWIQFQLKVFSGNWRSILVILKSIVDVIKHVKFYFTNKYRLNEEEFKEFCKLPAVPIYWKPVDEKP